MTSPSFFRVRILTALMIVLSLFFQHEATAVSVALAWNPSASATVTGYQVAYGPASNNYLWSVNVNTNNAMITGLNPGSNYYFAVLAYDAEGDESAFSDEITDYIALPPVISVEPVSATIATGATAVFTVTATSVAPVTYQWFDGSTALSGATNASLSLANASQASAGNYHVVVANNGGSVTSSIAILSVGNPPAIVSEPASRSVGAGTNIVFSISATGTGPLSYEWYFGTNAMPGQTNSTLTVSSANQSKAGGYWVFIRNSVGSIISTAATLSIIHPPVITSQPVAQAVVVGTNVAFSLAVSGSGHFTYRWFANGVALAGGTNQTLSLTDVTTANAGNYYVTVANAAAVVTSATVALVVTRVPSVPAGAYNGLFYQSSASAPAVTVATAGMLGNCVVGSTGIYSARVYSDGFSYSVTGTLNASGNDTEIVSRAANSLSNLTLSLHLDLSGITKTITGTVSNMDQRNSWTAPLLADLATNALAVPARTFVMSIPPVAGSANGPTGYGMAVVTTTAAGLVTVTGYLNDSTAISQTVPLAKDGTVPLYFSLYGGLGLAEGWLNFATETPTGTLTWIRPAGISTSTPYPKGFTNVINFGVGQ